MPQISLERPSATLGVQVGAHLTSAAPVTWDAEVNYDPSVDYKINTRQGGRFLAYQFTMDTPDDFSASGFDLDVLVTGKR